MIKPHCPQFAPASIFEFDLCKYWGPPIGQWPGHCKHRGIFSCDTNGLRLKTRADSDDDGEYDGPHS